MNKFINTLFTSNNRSLCRVHQAWKREVDSLINTNVQFLHIGESDDDGGERGDGSHPAAERIVIF